MSRSRRDIPKNEYISRKLSKILRHKGLEEGYEFSRDGFTPLDPIMVKLFKEGPKVTFEMIEKIVENNDKQRFTLVERPEDYNPYTGEGSGKQIWFIRANQGHSFKNPDGTPYLDGSLIFKEITEPFSSCIHGTNVKAIEVIMREGLSRMDRDYIHLALGMPDEVVDGEKVISGMRRKAKAVIRVDVPKAMDAGIKFYKSSNGVILTQGFGGVIPPEFLSAEMI
jgi:2'-phosphotransferase